MHAYRQTDRHTDGQMYIHICIAKHCTDDITLDCVTPHCIALDYIKMPYVTKPNITSD